MYVSVTKAIATVPVSINLYYCNSLIYNIALKNFTIFSRVHIFLTRVFTGLTRFVYAFSTLAPLRYHISFKMCTLTY